MNNTNRIIAGAIAFGALTGASVAASAQSRDTAESEVEEARDEEVTEGSGSAEIQERRGRNEQAQKTTNQHQLRRERQESAAKHQ